MNDFGKPRWHQGQFESRDPPADQDMRSGSRGDCTHTDDLQQGTTRRGAAGIQCSSKVVVLDCDIRRRGTIAHCLAGLTLFVEPLEGISEIAGLPYKPNVILAHSDGAMISLLVRELASLNLACPIIAYSETIKLQEVVESIQEGACDYLEWPADKARLVDALLKQLARAVVPANEADRAHTLSRRLPSLTRREQEIVDCYAQDMRLGEIANKLGITESTLACHRATIRRKLGCSKDSDALTLAREARNQSEGLNDVFGSNAPVSVGLRSAVNIKLTDRELEILSLVALGQSSKEIASSLGISIRTIESHRGNFLVKLKAKNSLEAINIAKELKIIS